MSSFVVVPFQGPWTREVEEAFLRSARAHYEHFVPNPTWRWPDLAAPARDHREPLAEKLYREGRLHGYLRISYAQFRAVLHRTRPRSYVPAYQVRFYAVHGVGFREKLPLLSRSGKKPAMTPSPDPFVTDRAQAARDWREEKQFRRDKARSRSCGCNRRKTWAKRASNGMHRAWERLAIQKADWDGLIGDFTLWTHDPWMWD